MEVTVEDMKLPSILGQVTFGDPSYEVKVGIEVLSYKWTSAFGYDPVSDCATVSHAAAFGIEKLASVTTADGDVQTLSRPLDFPFILGQIPFGDAHYHVRVGQSLVRPVDEIGQTVVMTRRDILQMVALSQQRVELYVVDAVVGDHKVQFQLDVREIVDVHDIDSYIHAAIQQITALSITDLCTKGVEKVPHDAVSTWDARTIDIERTVHLTTTVSELPHYFNVVKLKPTERLSIVVRDTDTLLVLVVDIEATKAMTAKQCWFVVTAYDSGEVVAKRLAHYMEGKLVLVDRIELQPGVYRGYFEIILDNGDVVTYPEQDIFIVVR